MQVSSLPWNHCPDSRGISVQFSLEYATGDLTGCRRMLLTAEPRRSPGSQSPIGGASRISRAQRGWQPMHMKGCAAAGE
jgi:hypothetical protein